MAVTSNKMDLILGIVLIVLGILVLTGAVGVGWVFWVAGILLIVVGVLMIVKVMAGGLVLGIVAIVIGAILISNNIIQGALGRVFGQVVGVVIGVLLLVFGIMKVLGK